ncbi:MFS general substrate transporter, partial [Paraphaeosphaeria sporulosa]
DPLNPHKWSLVRRWFQACTVSGIAFAGTFVSSVFTPAMEKSATDLRSSIIMGSLAYLIHPIGLTLGSPFAAPFNETFGRKPILLINLPIFALFVLGIGFAHSMVTFVVLCFSTGIFAALSLIIGPGILSDQWQPEMIKG